MNTDTNTIPDQILASLYEQSIVLARNATGNENPTEEQIRRAFDVMFTELASGNQGKRAQEIVKLVAHVVLTN